VLPSGTSVAAFGAQAGHVHVHDALAATGGTLYYLSHKEVVEGSVQVTLVVRDRVSGNSLARLPQRLGSDVVVKEFEGRLQFTRPIASVWDDGSLIGSASLQGHPVDIEVDYETSGRASEQTVAGGRVTQALGTQLTLGGTLVDDASAAGDYRLRGGDVAWTPVKGTRLLGEVAESHGHSGRAFRSEDGGLEFAAADSATATAGQAWKAAAEVDLGEWLQRPGVATLSAYARRVDAGFLSDGERGGVALERQGGRALLGLGRYGKLAARYDHESRPQLTQAGQVQATDVFGLQWRKDGARTGAAAEFEQRNTARVLDAINANAVAAVRWWVKPVTSVKATLEHQQGLSGEAQGQSALGLEWRATSRLALEARGAVGDLGTSLRGGATLSANGKQLYLRDERGGLSAAQSRTLFGVQAPLGPMSRAYSEYQWLRDASGERGVSVTGLEQGWRSKAGVAVQVAGEHGSRGTAGEHTTVSGALAYKGESPLSGSTRAEVRNLAGGSDGRQVASSTRLELSLPSGFALLGDLRLGQTKQLGGMPLRFQEQSVGLSWRAPRSEAVQALGRWTRLADRRAAAPGDSLSSESVLGVAALEGTVRLMPGLEWAMKGAARLQQDGHTGLPMGITHSTLWASRLDYRILQQPVRLGVEYRILNQREAQDSRSGWLQELSYDPSRFLRLGVGYNFSRFSGDPLVREQDRAQGWFLRAQSRY